MHAIDHLDDGSPIELTITINEKEGSAVFDFEGTGTEMIGKPQRLFEAFRRQEANLDRQAISTLRLPSLTVLSFTVYVLWLIWMYVHHFEFRRLGSL